MDPEEDDNQEGGGAGEGAGGEETPTIESLTAQITTLTEQQRKADERAAAAEKVASERAAELAKREAADKAAAEAEALRRGDHEKLLTERNAELAKATDELKKATERLAAHDKREADRLEAVAKGNEARIAQLPEAHRALVPVELKTDPDKLAAWFARADASGALKVAAGTEVNPNPGQRQPAATPDEIKTAARMGLDLTVPENLAYLRSVASRVARNTPTA